MIFFWSFFTSIILLLHFVLFFVSFMYVNFVELLSYQNLSGFLLHGLKVLFSWYSCFVCERGKSA